MSLFRALRNRSFALLWTGQTISRVGDFVYEIALAWWVLEKTGSPETMSLVLVFSITPSVLFLLIGGLAVDRMPRVLLMLASDAGRAGVALFVCALSYSGQLQVWHVYIASLFFGFVMAFFQPAYAAVVPQIVAADELPSANALTGISINLGRVAGPALGAALVGWLGSSTAFAINAGSFILSAVLLVPLLFAGIPGPARGEKNRALQDLREGFDTVLAKPWLWISILVFSLVNVTLLGPYNVAMPFLVSDFMQADVNRLGLLYSVFPIGFVVGGVWLGRYERISRRGPLMFVTLVIAALMLGLYGFHLPLWVLIVAALINGIALQAGALAWTHLLQEKIPNEQLGRVSSIDAMGSFSLMPLGMALGGWATGAFGPAMVFIVGGAVTALAGLGAILHPEIRALD
jgi:DHA3 family tetracycline resistance protein-like MFS transporter